MFSHRLKSSANLSALTFVRVRERLNDEQIQTAGLLQRMYNG